MLTLIEGGDLYAPESLGVQPLLVVGSRLGPIGSFDAEALRRARLPLTVIDARGCLVAPGFIDPHQHLLGAGGEQGFVSRQPEVWLDEIALAGITTVVGCLGTDTTTRQLASLLGKVRQLEQQGLNAFMYTGGFPVPCPTITTSVQDDLVLIDRVVGVGEVAISDRRSSQPSLDELARLVAQAYVGGTLSGKAGVVHFHVGPGRARLTLLQALLDNYEVAPESLYATHISRSEPLMDQAIALAQRGAYVDLDTVEADTARWLRYYLDHGGPPDRLSVSSDAHTPGGSPGQLHQAFISSARELSVDTVLPFFTANPAGILKLSGKGCLVEGMDADLVVLDSKTLQVRHLFARGRPLVLDGKLSDAARSEPTISNPPRAASGLTASSVAGGPTT